MHALYPPLPRARETTRAPLRTAALSAGAGQQGGAGRQRFGATGIIRSVLPAAVSRILPLLAVGVWSLAAAGCGPPPPAADSRPQPVAPLPTAAGALAGGGAGEPHVDVSVEALLGHAAPAILERRNPFRLGPAAGGGWPPGTPGSLADLWGREGDAGTEDGVPAGATTTAPSEPLDPLDGLRLIGFVETRDGPERVAVLTDGDGVFYGLVDDVVRGRYRVLAVRALSVDIEDLAHGTRKTLTLPES